MLNETAEAPALDREVVDRLRRAFENGAGSGLLQLGAGESPDAAPADIRLVARLLHAIRHRALRATPEAAVASDSADIPTAVACP